MIPAKFYRDELDIYNIPRDLTSTYKDTSLIHRYPAHSTIYIRPVSGQSQYTMFHSVDTFPMLS